MRQRIFSSFSSKFSRKAGLVASVLVVISVMASAYAGLRSNSNINLQFGEPPAQEVAITSAAQETSSEEVEAELITIRPTGFEPAEITRPKGAFTLAVDNRSGLVEVVLRLDRETGQRERDVRVPKNKLDWRGIVDLPAGRYVLTEANHADWVCHITITQQ